MKVEYTATGHEEVKGFDWVCYSRDSFNFTLLFDELLKVIKSAKEESFEELKETIREAYSAKTAKSNANLYLEGNSMDICKPMKTLPHIWINKNSVN